MIETDLDQGEISKCELSTQCLYSFDFGCDWERQEWRVGTGFTQPPEIDIWRTQYDEDYGSFISRLYCKLGALGVKEIRWRVRPDPLSTVAVGAFIV